MEKIPGVEGGKIEKEYVLEQLRAKGIEDPETMDLVNRWVIQREKETTEAGSGRSTIIFEIDRADLYLAAGDKQGALECLDGARTQAYNENEADLYEQIMRKMDEIEGGV